MSGCQGWATTPCEHHWSYFLLLLLIPGVLRARDTNEEKRIEHLLQTVESLKGAAFIRNGTEYDAKDALPLLVQR